MSDESKLGVEHVASLTARGRGATRQAAKAWQLIRDGHIPEPGKARGGKPGRPGYVFDVSYGAALAICVELLDARAIRTSEARSVWDYLTQARAGPAIIDGLLCEASAGRPCWFVLTECADSERHTMSVRLAEDGEPIEPPGYLWSFVLPLHRVLAPFVSIPAGAIQ